MKTQLIAEIRAFMEKTIGKSVFLLAKIVDSLLPKRKSNSHRKTSNKDVTTSKVVSAYNTHIFGKKAYEHFEYSTPRRDGGIYACMPYKEPEIRRAVWNFKYYLHKESLRLFACIMVDELVAHLTNRLTDLPLSSPALLIYSPSSSYCAGKKAFDQMRELSLEIEKLLGSGSKKPFMQICTDAVQVTKNDKGQHFGTRAERLQWSRERYCLSPAFTSHVKNLGPSVHIICIDDILTTGATFLAITNLLTSNLTGKKVRVDCFALCFTELGNKTQMKKMSHAL